MLLRIVCFACLIAFSYGRKAKPARRPTEQTTTLATVLNQPCIKEDNQQGECVPYFLCTDGETINQDGSYIVDTRRKREVNESQCNNLEMCCTLKSNLKTTTKSSVNASSKKACTSKSDQKGKCLIYYECDNDKIIYDDSDKPLCGDTEVCCNVSKPPAPAVVPQNKKDPQSKICDLDDNTKGRCIARHFCSPNDSGSFECPESNNVCCRSNATSFTISNNCGKRNTNGFQHKVNETPRNSSKYAEFPWMIVLTKKTKIIGIEKVITLYKCGGSLIHPRVVLTAAHCVNNEYPSDIIIRAGEWDAKKTDEPNPHQEITAKKILLHPMYKNGPQINDIAIIILHYDFKEADNVGFICLPPADYTPDAQSCLVSGWGKVSSGRKAKYSSLLKKTEVPILNHKKCEESLRRTKVGRRFKLDESFLCAGGNRDKDVCKGDGGSPLVCKMPNSERYMQTGIVSWGIGCSNGVPGVYTNVGLMRDWIDFELSENGIDMLAYVKL